MNFNFENVVIDEPEGVCELEPGVFAVVVTVQYADGRRTCCVYKTMVPYNFPAQEPAAEKADEGTETPVESSQPETAEKQETNQGTDQKTESGNTGIVVVILLVVCGSISMALYLRIVQIRRERKRKLEYARKERQRIRQETEEII
jgi:hypothetical protein